MGYKVSVFEAQNIYGGKLGEMKTEGYRFDLGPSLFTMPQLVEELFELCDERWQNHFEYVELDEICHYFFNADKKMTAFSDLLKYEEEINTVFGQQANSIQDYFKEIRKLYEITHHIFLEKSLHRVGSFLNLKTLISFLQLYKLKINVSLARYNKRYFANKALEKVFNRYATYNGSDPYECPATLRIIPHLEQHFGTFFPSQGMRSIIESLYALALRQGIEFQFEQKVEQIVVEDKRCNGIMSNGIFHKAELVISNTDVNFTYKDLLSASLSTHKSLKNPLSSSAIIFYWGLELQSDLSVHNILFSKDYEAEFQDIFQQDSVSQDPTIYVHISSKMKKDDAPVGGENWFVMVNTSADNGQNWDQLVELTRAAVLKKIKDYLNIDIEAHLKTEHIRDPLKLQAETGAFSGALYGSNSNSVFSAFLRHPNFSSKIKGLYFCGGTVHPGGGIPLCLLSAKICSQLIKEDYPNGIH